MKCIYCRKLKDDSEFTKEHLIPEPLGGHFVPDLIIGNVCKTCNNNFGLFVDAEFTSNYVIAQKLQLAELALFDKENPSAVSLICMGNSLLSPPQMQDNEICEHWTGPLGEIIYWVRPKDERLSGYAGGNPRTTKDQKSRAYFHFSERTIKYPKITWLAFKNAFKKRSTVKKILNCVINIDPKTIGFTDPDDLDQLRMKFFSDEHSANSIRQVQYPFNPNVGYRFLAKLAIGIGYSLFGEKVLETSYAKELYRALQCRDGDNIPLIHGFFDSSKNQDIKNLGEANTVTIIIQIVDDKAIFILNICASLYAIVPFAATEDLNQEDLDKIGYGRVIVICKPLKNSYKLSYPDYLNYKCGNLQHPELAAISERATRNQEYFSNL